MVTIDTRFCASKLFPTKWSPLDWIGEFCDVPGGLTYMAQYQSDCLTKVWTTLSPLIKTYEGRRIWRDWVKHIEESLDDLESGMPWRLRILYINTVIRVENGVSQEKRNEWKFHRTSMSARHTKSRIYGVVCSTSETGGNSRPQKVISNEKDHPRTLSILRWWAFSESHRQVVPHPKG
jgi:hypothetical protein